MRNRISPADRIRYFFRKRNPTEDDYRLQYERMYARHFSRKSGCLKIGPLNLPLISPSGYPTREDAYYAMEIGDILYPGLLESYAYVDEGPYEWMDIEVKPGDTVFDCGANLGVFSLYAAYRGAEVYAFEPIAGARAWIRKGLELNPGLQGSVEIVPFAVADRCGTAEFTVLDNTLVGSSMVLSQEGRKVTAKTVTVDAFCADRGIVPSFIKADIEGAERLMLAGAADTLAGSAPKLAVCTYHLPDDRDVLRRLILSANPRYRITEKWKKYYAGI